MMKYTIFWDSGQPGGNGKSQSWPCGWCWIAVDEDGEPVGSSLLGASGRPSLAVTRTMPSLVRELRAQVKDSKLPTPPTVGEWHGQSCVVA